MAAKIAAFLITLVLTVILAVIGFALLMLALNGYSESDSMYSMGTYGIFAFLLVFAAAAIAAGVAHLLIAREFKTVGAVMISTIAAGAFAVVAILVLIVIGVLLAEYFQRYS